MAIKNKPKRNRRPLNTANALVQQQVQMLTSLVGGGTSFTITFTSLALVEGQLQFNTISMFGAPSIQLFDTSGFELELASQVLAADGKTMACTKAGDPFVVGEAYYVADLRGSLRSQFGARLTPIESVSQEP